jgi:hypothetical protein
VRADGSLSTPPHPCHAVDGHSEAVSEAHSGAASEAVSEAHSPAVSETVSHAGDVEDTETPAPEAAPDAEVRTGLIHPPPPMHGRVARPLGCTNVAAQA